MNQVVPFHLKLAAMLTKKQSALMTFIPVGSVGFIVQCPSCGATREPELTADMREEVIVDPTRVPHTAACAVDQQFRCAKDAWLN